MDAHLQHDQQGLPPPSHYPPWNPSPPPPATAGAFLTQSQPFTPHYPPSHHHHPHLPHHQSVPPPHPNHPSPWPSVGDYPPPTYHQHPPPHPNFTSVGMPGLPPSAYPPTGVPSYPTGPPRYPYPHSLPPQPVPPPLPGAAPHSFTPLQPPSNQVWGNTSWHQQQNWEQQDRNFPYKNEEDWAAKAKAWAAANSVPDSQALHLQYAATVKREEQSYAYQDSYQLAVEQPSETQPNSSGSQHLPISVPDHHRKPSNLQESSSLTLEPSSYPPDARPSYGSRFEGGITAKETTTSPHVNFGSGSSFLEKEVSSSYSSIAGKELGNQYEKPNAPAATSALYGDQYTNPPGGFNDQPLVFEQRYAFDHDQSQKINYRDATAAVSGTSYIDSAPPVHSWTPSASFSHLPSSGQQPTMGFGRVPGPTFHPSVSPGGAPFAVGVGASIHGVTAFTEDVNGGFSSVERPKKPSVPNWLREELIKKKASIVSSTNEQVSRNSHSFETDDEDEKPFGRSEQADGKSMDSSRSGEDDNDDEDEVEAVRSAAINQEIKRVLTEILLKVTDELFEEIATRVLDEDEDPSVKVDNNTVASQMVPSPTSITPKTTAKVTIPASQKTSGLRATERSVSVSTKGNILGLANYSSDEDDDVQEKEDRNTTTALNIAGTESLVNAKKNIDAHQDIKRVISKDNEASIPKGNAMHNASSLSMSTFQQEQSTSMANDTHPAVSGQHHNVIIQNEIDHLPSLEAHNRSHTGNKVAVGNTDNVISGPNSSKNVDTTRKSGESRSRGTRDVDEYVTAPQSSKDSGSKSHKNDVSETMRRNSRENNNGDREARHEKKLRNKEDAKKKEHKNARDDQSGHGDRDKHRSKSRRSVSPVGRAKSSKEKNNQDSAFNDSVSRDSRKRKSHSHRRSLSRSPSRTGRRPASRSPNTKTSQRRHSPSYTDKRRR